MSSLGANVPVGWIRKAVATRADETSLRAVAREIGVSHDGLRKFLQGARPQARTEIKLQRWFEAQRAHLPAASFLSPADALEVLLQEIPTENRDRARSMALEFLAGLKQKFR